MQNDKRQGLNLARLKLIDASIRPRVEAVIKDLESLGFFPLIDGDVFRSPAVQMQKFRAGVSRLRWGFHCAEDKQGNPASLAADIIEADLKWNAPAVFWLSLGFCALRNGLNWGGFFGLNSKQRDALKRLLVAHTAGTILTVKPSFGWDVAHVETAFVTVADARQGKRGTPAQLAFKWEPIPDSGGILFRVKAETGAQARPPIPTPFDFEDSGANIRAIGDSLKPGAEPEQGSGEPKPNAEVRAAAPEDGASMPPPEGVKAPEPPATTAEDATKLRGLEADKSTSRKSLWVVILGFFGLSSQTIGIAQAIDLYSKIAAVPNVGAFVKVLALALLAFLAYKLLIKRIIEGKGKGGA